jgi:hypothetical protein
VLNVLKEKQGIHWQGMANAIFTFAMSKKLNDLSHAAGLTKKHVVDVKKPKTADSTAADSAATTTPTLSPLTRISSVDSTTLEDAAKKKREERMKKEKGSAAGGADSQKRKESLPKYKCIQHL